MRLGSTKKKITYNGGLNKMISGIVILLIILLLPIIIICVIAEFGRKRLEERREEFLDELEYRLRRK